MRTPRPGSFLVSLAVAALLGALPVAAQQNPKNIDQTASPRGGPSTGLGLAHFDFGGGFTAVHPEFYQLWKSLPGTYETSDGASRLSLTLRPLYPYVYFLEARTTAGGQESIERGRIFLGDASPSYVSKKMRFEMVYQPETLRNDYSCTLFGAPTADGITFESEASDCSFPLGRRISKLQIDSSRTGITVSGGKDGETTLLTRRSGE